MLQRKKITSLPNEWRNISFFSNTKLLFKYNEKYVVFQMLDRNSSKFLVSIRKLLSWFLSLKMLECGGIFTWPIQDDRINTLVNTYQAQLSTIIYLLSIQIDKYKTGVTRGQFITPREIAWYVQSKEVIFEIFLKLKYIINQILLGVIIYH